MALKQQEEVLHNNQIIRLVWPTNRQKHREPGEGTADTSGNRDEVQTNYPAPDNHNNPPIRDQGQVSGANRISEWSDRVIGNNDRPITSDQNNSSLVASHEPPKQQLIVIAILSSPQCVRPWVLTTNVNSCGQIKLYSIGELAVNFDQNDSELVKY